MKVKSCAEPVVEAVGSQSCDGMAMTMSCCFPGIDEKGGSVTVSSFLEGDLSVSSVFFVQLILLGVKCHSALRIQFNAQRGGVAQLEAHCRTGVSG